jgi:hypothetical protein
MMVVVRASGMCSLTHPERPSTVTLATLLATIIIVGTKTSNLFHAPVLALIDFLRHGREFYLWAPARSSSVASTSTTV